MPKKHDFLVVGAALVDIIAETGPIKRVTMPGTYIEHRMCLSLASKTLLKSMKISPGGSALNVAVTIDCIGGKPAFLTCIGDDVLGDYILESLKKTGIGRSYLRRAPAQTGIGIGLISGGEKSSLVYHGAIDALGEKDVTAQMITGSKRILITSLTSKKNYALFLKILNLAKKHKKQVIFAPSITMLKEFKEKLRKLRYPFDMLLVNYEEGSFLTHKKAIKSILESLPARVAVVTKDREGAYAREGKKLLSVSPIKVKVRNTTGAGDAFCGAFVHKYYKTGSLKAALKAATAVASMKLGKIESEIKFSPAQVGKVIMTNRKTLKVAKI